MKVFQLFFAFLLLAVSFVLAEDTGKKDEPLDHEKEHTFRSDEKKHMREEHQMDEGDFDEESFFRMHDTDGDGLLSFDELVAVYQQDQGTEADGSDGATAARQAVEAYLEIADKDKNGRISFEEFKSSLDLPFEPEHADGGSDTPLNFQE